MPPTGPTYHASALAISIFVFFVGIVLALSFYLFRAKRRIDFRN